VRYARGDGIQSDKPAGAAMRYRAQYAASAAGLRRFSFFRLSGRNVLPSLKTRNRRKRGENQQFSERFTQHKKLLANLIYNNHPCYKNRAFEKLKEKLKTY